jgi:argininosuccinate synthase
MRILLAYSGGLDTSYLTAFLSRELGHAITTCTINCGGLTAVQQDQIANRALAYGAVEHIQLDARPELFHRVIRWLLSAHIKRGQIYPLCVGAERGLQAEKLAQYALEQKFDGLAHGCTAAGNDQIRFDAALRICAPDLKVLAPIRDAAPSRDQQISWLKSQNLPLPAASGQYSINAGLWGLTLGGGPLLDSLQGLPAEAWVWTQTSSKPVNPESLRIEFKQGIPVALNQTTLGPVELIEALNVLAGKHAIGRGYHLGDTVLGIKGRIAFEAPAAEVLLLAHRELEKLVLTEDQRFWKDHLGEVYGRKLHQGLFHDPLLRDFEALFAHSQTRVSGQVNLDLEQGRAVVTGLQSPYSMMAASDAQYGELAATDSDPASLRCVAQVLAEPARLYAQALTS